MNLLFTTAHVLFLTVLLTTKSVSYAKPPTQKSESPLLKVCTVVLDSLSGWWQPPRLGTAPSGPLSLQLRIGNPIVHNGFAEEMWKAVKASLKDPERENPKFIFHKAIERLTSRRSDIAKNSGDENWMEFGEFREVSPEGEIPRYITAMGKKYLTSLYLGQKFAIEEKEWPIQRSIKLKVGSKSKNITLTRFEFDEESGTLTIWHMPHEDTLWVLNHAQKLYIELMTKPLTNRQIIGKTAELHWWMAQAMPFKRGSAAIADALTKIVFKYHGIPVGRWKTGVTADIIAFFTTPQTFTKNYPQLFE